MTQVNIIILFFTLARSVAAGMTDVSQLMKFWTDMSHIVKIQITDPALILVTLWAWLILVPESLSNVIKHLICTLLIFKC